MMKNIIKYLSWATASYVIFVGASTLSVSADEKPNPVETVPITTDISEKSTEPITTTSTIITTASSPKSITTILTTAAQYNLEPVVTQPVVTSEITEGWNSINNKWFYYNGEQFVTGVQEIDGEKYLFAANGALRTGWQTVNSKRCYYDENTHSPVYGWVGYLGNTYYNDKDRGKLTGKQKIDNDTYIFSQEGIKQYGFVLYENYMYYCNELGKVIFGNSKKTPVEINGSYYLISPKGYVLRGWQTVNGLRLYFDYDTCRQIFGWLKYHDNYYYIDKENGKYIGDQYINSYPYRFDYNGILLTGLQHFETENKTSYFYEDGKRAVDQIVYTDNGNYYFNSDGFMEIGWHTVKNKKYYFNSDGKMALGFQTIKNKKYYFGQDGAVCTGLRDINGSRYYFNSDGIMQYSWQTINNKKYYFDLKSGKAFKGWNTINNNKYYFDENYIMATGKYKIGEYTYYFGNDGKMRTGWQTISNDRYNFGNDGKMLTYRHVIDNINCLFYSTGVLATTGNQLIVVTALSQLGQEGGRPYWTWWGFNFRIEWCACFVSWCANVCGYTQNGKVPEFISCKVGIDWFKAHNQWKGKNYIPKSGDYIFFDWEPDGVADHIGIVDYYEDGYVYTVEGNSGDVVRKNIYEIKSQNIYGFAAPNF